MVWFPPNNASVYSSTLPDLSLVMQYSIIAYGVMFVAKSSSGAIKQSENKTELFTKNCYIKDRSIASIDNAQFAGKREGSGISKEFIFENFDASLYNIKEIKYNNSIYEVTGVDKLVKATMAYSGVNYTYQPDPSTPFISITVSLKTLKQI